MDYTYFVSTDIIDTDDCGEEQVTLLTQKVHSNTELTDDEVIELAEESGEWKHHFGEGELEKVGSYSIEPTF